MKIDAVFEGGGTKCIGLVGAACYFEDKGYRWEHLAGTSAGAIIASLIACGYTGKELKSILLESDFSTFIDKDRLRAISMINKPIKLIKNKGVYSINSLEKFVSNLILKKGKSKFKDISVNGKSRLKIIATDITQKNMLILPDDLVRYGIEPMEFEIAKAVAMSACIPLYFKPIKLTYKNGYSFIVDGGLLSNFPIWIFDVEGVPRWPTFGFKLAGNDIDHTAGGKVDFISYLLDIVSTMIDKNEEIYIKDKDAVRTVFIPTLGIKTTKFDLSRKMKLKSFQTGYTSAKKFLDSWDFQEYIKKYRK